MLVIWNYSGWLVGWVGGNALRLKPAGYAKLGKNGSHEKTESKSQKCKNHDRGICNIAEFLKLIKKVDIRGNDKYLPSPLVLNSFENSFAN